MTTTGIELLIDTEILPKSLWKDCLEEIASILKRKNYGQSEDVKTIIHGPKQAVQDGEKRKMRHFYKFNNATRMNQITLRCHYSSFKSKKKTFNVDEDIPERIFIEPGAGNEIKSHEKAFAIVEEIYPFFINIGYKLVFFNAPESSTT